MKTISYRKIYGKTQKWKHEYEIEYIYTNEFDAIKTKIKYQEHEIKKYWMNDCLVIFYKPIYM